MKVDGEGALNQGNCDRCHTVTVPAGTPKGHYIYLGSGKFPPALKKIVAANAAAGQNVNNAQGRVVQGLRNKLAPYHRR